MARVQPLRFPEAQMHDDQGLSRTLRLSDLVHQRTIPVRTSAFFFTVLTALLTAMLPQFAEAGPCSSDITDLETAIRLFGGNPPAGQERQSAVAQPNQQPAPDPARRRLVQFSATMARAKRLDTDGDRFGCIGALNAARRMYVLVATQ
jgi:hypothetical protein